jgi:uncharacterized integral membrane protein
MINLFTLIGLTAGGSSTVHIYAQTIHRTAQIIMIVIIIIIIMKINIYVYIYIMSHVLGRAVA